MPNNNDSVCKGSFALGTACGNCARCALEREIQQSNTAVNCISEVKSNPDPPSCHCCGAMMVPSGYKCLSCGATTKVNEPIEGFVAAKPLCGKYGITPQLKIVNLVSGQEIPEDEPLFLLRARDKFAIATLMYYLITCKKECNELHLEGIKQVIDKFKKFADECNERMKQPGISKDLKLQPPHSEARNSIQELLAIIEDTSRYPASLDRYNYLILRLARVLMQHLQIDTIV